jgi:hypothetical protein
MRRALLLGLGCLSLVSFGATKAGADDNFIFDPHPTFQSVGVSTTLVEFVAPLRTLNPAGDDLFVVFDPHIPSGWFAQYCQLSTGQCFPDDHVISLRSSDPDTLRIDFRPVAGIVGQGHIDIRIYRVADPGTWKEVTFALGHGVTLPVSSYSYKCEEAFQETVAWGEVSFFSQIRSYNAFNDSLIVEIQRETPTGWVSQYCQTSTGQCYPDRQTIPFNAFVIDTLRVDFLCYSPATAIGNVRIKTQSRSNPAVWYALPFRVRTGDIPAVVGSDGSAGDLAIRVVPNPVRDMADIRFVLRCASPVRLTLVDLAGRQVLDRTTGTLGAGIQRIPWDGRDDSGNRLASGVYFYQVEGPAQRAMGKITISR